MHSTLEIQLHERAYKTVRADMDEMQRVVFGALALSSCTWPDVVVQPPSCLCTRRRACPRVVPPGEYVVHLGVNHTLVVDACEAGPSSQISVNKSDGGSALERYYSARCVASQGGGAWAALDSRRRGAGDYTVAVGGGGAVLYVARAVTPKPPWEVDDSRAGATLSLTVRVATPDTVPVAAVVGLFQPPGTVSKMAFGSFSRLRLTPVGAAGVEALRTIMKAAFPADSEVFVDPAGTSAAAFWRDGASQMDRTRADVARTQTNASWDTPVNASYYEVSVVQGDGKSAGMMTTSLGRLVNAGGALWFESLGASSADGPSTPSPAKTKLSFVSIIGIVGGVASTIFGTVAGFISVTQSGRGFFASFRKKGDGTANSNAIAAAAASNASVSSGRASLSLSRDIDASSKVAL